MKVVEELKNKLLNADAATINLLQQNEDPVYWFLLLSEYPAFAPESSWWFNLRNRCDLPWSKLLVKQPQFEKYCHWESVSRLDLMLIAHNAPEIFKRHFHQYAYGDDLYDFLTTREKVELLIDAPEYEELVDWDELAEQFTVGNWFTLLLYQPQFEKYFDWHKVEKQPLPYWDMLLKKQPQFAIHCDFAQLYPNQRRRLKKLFEGKE